MEQMSEISEIGYDGSEPFSVVEYFGFLDRFSKTKIYDDNMVEIRPYYVVSSGFDCDTKYFNLLKGKQYLMVEKEYSTKMGKFFFFYTKVNVH
jgi:hypothetical protein